MANSHYELALVMRPDLEGDARDGMIRLVEKLVKQYEGDVTKREEAGKKNLAYPIQKLTEGWYYFLGLVLPPEAVAKLDMKLKIEEKLLRYLIVKRGAKVEKKEMKKRSRAK